MKNKFFISNIIFSIIAIILLCSTVVTASTDIFFDKNFEGEIPEITSNLDSDINPTEDLDELNTLIIECSNKMNVAHEMAENARMLGHEENSVVIQIAQYTWWEYHDLYIIYKERYDTILVIKQQEEAELQAKLEAKKAQYPVAYDVWMFLKNYGYNDYICAAIIGNMMVECGGNTLDLDYTLYTPDRYYYGLCQWNKGGFPHIFDKGVPEQLDLLINTIEYEIDTFGFCYKSKFKYNDFIQMINEKDAALAFAKTYERCASFSYAKRQKCAAIAYDYFVN